MKINRKKINKLVETRMKEAIKEGRIGSAICRVTQNQKVVYQASFGKPEPGSDTLFRMASMTKPVTAAAALIQISRGLIDLFDPLSKYLPMYEKMEIGKVNERGELESIGKATNQIRLLHLLTHTSGVGSGEVGDKAFSMLEIKPGTDLEQVTNSFADFPLAFEPYTQNAYSPLLGLDLIARVVEITSGMKFADFVKKELFLPLGMEQSTFDPTPLQRCRMIPMHDRVDGKSVVVDMPSGSIFESLPVSYTSGGAGLASCLDDYSRFADFLLTGRAGYRQLLPPSFLRSMALPHIPESLASGDETWGLGVRTILTQKSQPLPKGCFGWSGAYGTHFWVDPANDLTAILLKNSHYDGGSGALTSRHFEEDVMNSLE